jgi:hypothetical protein
MPKCELNPGNTGVGDRGCRVQGLNPGNTGVGDIGYGGTSGIRGKSNIAG